MARNFLQLCQKTQAGKKGKKVASGNNGLGQIGKNIYIGSAAKPTELSASTLEDAQKLAVQKMIEEFPNESSEVLNDFFKDIDKQMKKWDPDRFKGEIKYGKSQMNWFSG